MLFWRWVDVITGKPFNLYLSCHPWLAPVVAPITTLEQERPSSLQPLKDECPLSLPPLEHERPPSLLPLEHKRPPPLPSLEQQRMTGPTTSTTNHNCSPQSHTAQVPHHGQRCGNQMMNNDRFVIRLHGINTGQWGSDNHSGIHTLAQLVRMPSVWHASFWSASQCCNMHYLSLWLVCLMPAFSSL